MNSASSLRAIFNEALDRQDAVVRARYLDEACGADAALRERVERLLRADEEAGGFFSDPNSRPQSFNPPPSTLILPVTEKAGERIGRYKLREKIGEGGCGVVYVAEQEEPVRRRVALKVIKLGMDTQQVIARFGAERQALAMMDHPNIAKVLDAGATETGRPYFVMELVKGIRITDYCDQNNLSTEARLELFHQVCRAIQHAHQKGIIHRDIKPSNILVTLHDGVPVPKVIDFGIAKATEGRLTDLTVYTELHQFIGTPAYMSPEQAEMSGLDIDTRSDIYALGVLLYELLTGQTPFDPKELIAAGLDEMRRTIREKEPTRPSTCLSTMLGADLTEVAKHRQAEPARLASLIRGDLDWIVMKALEKDRNRRYETANGLAADIQRHLQNEPVMARAPTNLYRFQKLIRRNKLAFAAISAVTLALLMGLAATTWIFFKEKAARQRAVAAEQAQSHLREAAQKSQANEVKLRQQAEANEKKAQTEASKSTQVAQFLKDMLSGVGPSVALGRDTRMLREILDKTAGRIGNDLKKQPDVEAELRNILGVVYRDLGEYEKAKAMHRQALALQKSLLGDNDAAVARTLNSLGSMLTVEGKLAEAEVVLREALVIRRKLFGNDGRELGEALDNLGSALCFQPGKSAEAATLIYEGLAIRKKAHGSEDPMIAFSLDNVGRVLQAQGKLAEAEAAWREAWMLRKKQLGEEHVLVANSLFYLANVLNSQGKLQEAEARQRESLQLYRKLLGNDDRRVDMALYHLAVILEEQGKLAEAEGVWREELAIEKKLSGDESPFVANSLMALSGVLKRQNKLVEAEAVIREALAMRKKLLGNEHPDVAATLENLSAFLLEQGRLAEAQTAQSEAVAIRAKTPAAPAR